MSFFLNFKIYIIIYFYGKLVRCAKDFTDLINCRCRCKRVIYKLFEYSPNFPNADFRVLITDALNFPSEHGDFELL